MLYSRLRWAPGLILLLALLAVPLTAAAQLSRPLYVPDEVLVTYRPGAEPAQRLRAARAVGAVAQQPVKGSPIQRLRLAPGTSVAAAIAALQRDPAVARVQPNFLYYADDHVSPDDPKFTNGDLWGLHNTGQNSGTADADVDAPEAWHLSTGSKDVVVAVIDTGVDYSHPDLQANIWTNPGETGLDLNLKDKATNGSDDDGNGYVDDVHGWDAYNNDGDPMDDNGHGTHVAGTIGAAGNNGIGVVGVNWNVSIIGVKFLSASGSGSTVDAVECLNYLHKLKESGINIIASNNSWGGGGYDEALKDAIDRSNALGILFVAAAGNGDFLGRAIDNDSSPHYPSSYDSANIIAVTATDRNDKKASWANYGATSVDLGAPGVAIWSTIPGNGYDSYSGTSMATPQVTGAVALLRAYATTLTHLQIKDRILTTGDPNADLEGKTVTGGRLNVYNALTNTIPQKPVKPTLAVNVTTDYPSYKFGQYVYITVNATDGTSAVGGASVSLVVQTANGKKYSGSGTTGSDGNVTFKYRPRKSDGKGTYTATGTASKDGYNSGSGSTTFTVQ